MTAHTLPDDPVYAFTPAYDFEDTPQQIRIVFQGMEGYVPTALVALSIADAERLCDRLNAKLGLDREAWTRLAANPWPPAAADRRFTDPAPDRRSLRQHQADGTPTAMRSGLRRQPHQAPILPTVRSPGRKPPCGADPCPCRHS